MTAWCGEAGREFAQLQSLNLGDNRIGSWLSVDALASFPALTDVRLTGNPVIPQAEADARYEVWHPKP